MDMDLEVEAKNDKRIGRNLSCKLRYDGSEEMTFVNTIKVKELPPISVSGELTPKYS